MPAAKPTLEFIPVGWDELVEKFGESREELLVFLNNVLRKFGKELVPEVKKETPYGAKGKLRKTTVFQVIGKGDDMRMEIRQSSFSKKGFPYGVAVRLGTKPHFPPSSELVPWVMAKLGVASQQAPGVAFLVARKISRVGTQPNPYHERAYATKEGALKKIFKSEMTAFVDNLEGEGGTV